MTNEATKNEIFVTAKNNSNFLPRMFFVYDDSATDYSSDIRGIQRNISYPAFYRRYIYSVLKTALLPNSEPGHVVVVWKLQKQWAVGNESLSSHSEDTKKGKVFGILSPLKILSKTKHL
jgi:hypothetical protein